MKYLLLVIALIGIGALVYFIFSKKKSSADIVVVSAGESHERVENLGLRQEPLEDPGILRVSEIRFDTAKKIPDDDNYRADPEIEWIVDIHPPKDFRFKKDKFLEVFNSEWGQEHPCWFYAHFPATNEWSFAVSADSGDEFDSLEMAVELADAFDEEELSPDKLESYLKELKTRLRKFGEGFEVIPREPIHSAVKRSTSLKKFQRELEPEILVVLRSDSRFKSEDFWNALVDVGLTWGDGDLFHWENKTGSDQFFSVWTSTEPGYFLPEDVAAGNFNPEDLIFGFSIPRTADPERVFDMMVEAVEYCQTKLGGAVLDQDGKPFDKQLYKNKIQQTVNEMKKQGLNPGEGLALRLF